MLKYNEVEVFVSRRYPRYNKVGPLYDLYAVGAHPYLVARSVLAAEIDGTATATGWRA